MEKHLRFEDCKIILKNKFGDDNFDVVNFTEEEYSEDVNGFIGEYVKIKINYTRNGETKCDQFFGKCNPPSNSFRKNFINEGGIFDKELFIYKTLIMNNNVNWAPKLYFYKTKELLVMEDLSEYGFRTINLNKDETFDVAHCKLVLKALAAFHACGLIYEHKESLSSKSKFYLGDTYPEQYKELLFDKTEGTLSKDYIDSSLRGLNVLIDVLPANSCISNKDFKEKLQPTFFKVIEILKPSKKYRNATCHGDIWANNIMIRYDDDGNPIDCRLIDFQATRYTPPAHDVTMFLYVNTTTEFRKLHFDDMLDFYYEQLSKELKVADLSIDEFITKRDFDVTCNIFLPVAKFIRVIYLSLILFGVGFFEQHKIDDIVKMIFADRTRFILDHYKKSPKYRNAMIEMMVDIRDMIIEDRISKEDCTRVLKKKLMSTNFDLINYHVNPLGANLLGYLGDHNILSSTVRFNGHYQNLTFFMKILPTMEVQKNLVCNIRAFEKEIFIYDELFKSMERVGVKNIGEYSPQWYLGRTDHCVILENLSEKNFKIADKYQWYGCSQLKLALLTLAKFHSSSIIYEEIMSEKNGKQFRINEKYEDNLYDTIYVDEEGHFARRHIETSTMSLKKQVDLFSELQTSSMSNDEFKNRIEKVLSKIYDYIKPSKKYRNVVCHGDLWSSNIMFLQENDEYVDCRICDYQFCRYTIPASDVLCLIYQTTEPEFRNIHLNDMLKHYHQCLSIELNKYGYDIEKFVSFDDFISSCDYIKPFAVAQTAILLQYVMIKDRYMNDLYKDRKKFSKVINEEKWFIVYENCENDPNYRKILRNTMIDLQDICLTLK